MNLVFFEQLFIYHVRRVSWRDGADLVFRSRAPPPSNPSPSVPKGMSAAHCRGKLIKGLSQAADDV